MANKVSFIQPNNFLWQNTKKTYKEKLQHYQNAPSEEHPMLERRQRSFITGATGLPELTGTGVAQNIYTIKCCIISQPIKRLGQELTNFKLQKPTVWSCDIWWRALFCHQCKSSGRAFWGTLLRLCKNQQVKLTVVVGKGRKQNDTQTSVGSRSLS